MIDVGASKVKLTRNVHFQTFFRCCTKTFKQGRTDRQTRQTDISIWSVIQILKNRKKNCQKETKTEEETEQDVLERKSMCNYIRVSYCWIFHLSIWDSTGTAHITGLFAVITEHNFRFVLPGRKAHARKISSCNKQALCVKQLPETIKRVNRDLINQVQPKKHFLWHHTPVKISTPPPMSKRDFIWYKYWSLSQRFIIICNDSLLTWNVYLQNKRAIPLFHLQV